MAVRGRAVHKKHTSILFYLPLTIYFSKWLPVWAISWKVKKGLKLGL